MNRASSRVGIWGPCAALFTLATSCGGIRGEVLEKQLSADAGGSPPVENPDSGTPDGGASCVPTTEAANYPVKVMFLVENRSAMCVADPPGGSTSGLCQQFAPPGVTESGRVKALRAFRDQHLSNPSTKVALLTWDLLPVSVLPEFSAAGSLTDTVLMNLQSNLGSVSETQGALESAVARLEADILASAVAERQRTKYVIVILGTGVPSPRCSANDSLPAYASASQPDGVWPDSPPATASLCNSNPDGGLPSACDANTGMDPGGNPCIPGFTPGTDRNQNTQLLGPIDQLLAFKAKYGLGDIRVHTRLLFNSSTFQACGPLCDDIFGMPPSDARTLGVWTLRQIAEGHGGGTFEDPGDPATLSLSSIDVRSLATFCP